MKTVNFAILGCGKIGTRHAEKLKNIDYVRLAAVCDIIPAKAQDLAEKHVCRPYSDINELVKDPSIDFVNICTPSGLHAEHTITCLKAGKNVLCEKPMALKTVDALTMVKTAKRHQKLLYVVKQNRYNAPVQLVKQLLDEGTLGRPIMCVVNMFWNRRDEYYVSDPWRGTLALDGGTIYTQASHFVDLMLAFMGRPRVVYSLMGTKNHPIEIEDTGTIMAEFDNGAYGSMSYTTCATNRNVEGSMTFIFANGTIRIGGEYLNTIDYFEVKGVDSYNLAESMPDANDYGTYRGSSSNHHEIFQDILERFNDGHYTGRLVHGDEAVETIRFIEAAFQSVKSGLPVKLD